MELQYLIVRRHRRKSASIRVSSDDRVTVTVPHFLSDDQVAQLIDKKSDWIRKKLKRNAQIREHGVRGLLSEKGEILYLGDPYELRLENGTATMIELEGQHLRVRRPVTAGEGMASRDVALLLIRWYKARALEYTVERVRFFSRMLGVQFNGIRIRTMKSRWGSCSSKGNIAFDWRLIMAPPGIVDYVVVHELCHLVHLNHSREFWSLVESIFPDYKIRGKHLKSIEERLSFIGSASFFGAPGSKRETDVHPARQGPFWEMLV